MYDYGARVQSQENLRSGEYSGKQSDYTIWKSGKSIPDNNTVHTNKMSIYMTENNLDNGFLSVNNRAFLLSKNSFSSYFGLAKTLGIANIVTQNFFNPAVFNIKNSTERTKMLLPLANEWINKVTLAK